MKILSENLWKEMASLARVKGRKSAAVAYVTSDQFVKFGPGDTLVCDASDHAIKAGQTTVAVLRSAYERGAKLYSYPGLHSKIYAFDRVVVVGSANLSQSSSDLLEAALVTSGARAVTAVRYLIDALCRDATEIDETFLDRAAALPVTPRRGHGRKRRRGPKPPEAKFWLVAVTQLDDDDYPEEQQRADEGTSEVVEEHKITEDEVEWIRITGGSRFGQLAKPGDSVIQVWKQNKRAKRIFVYRPTPLLRRQVEPTCTRFYVHGFADAEKTRIPFGRFEKLWKGAGVAGKLSRSPIRLISRSDVDRLLALWEAE